VGRQNDIRTIYISLNKFSCNGWNEDIGRLFPTIKSDSSMHRINEKYIIILAGKFERNHLGDPVVDRRIILK
jgi:hypothetical protein